MASQPPKETLTKRKELMWRAKDVDQQGTGVAAKQGSSAGAGSHGTFQERRDSQRRLVKCEFESISHNRSFDSWTTYDNQKPFIDRIRMEIIQLEGNEMVVDIIGLHPALANALRRILIAEVPTMAIEKVWIKNNTSIVQDEVLSHRLGLIPLRVDPTMFEYIGDSPTDVDTLVFDLHVRAEPGQPRTSVYARDLVWKPEGNQEEVIIPAPAPLEPDILIAKLAGDQEIELTVHAHKGIGKDHTKFSPVAPATYRLLPEIHLQRPFLGEEARQLVETCPMGVFDIEDIGGKQKAIVARPRNCSLCRECIRDLKWRKDISINRVKDHFIFSIESVGAVPPEVLFRQAIEILISKADDILQAFEAEAQLDQALQDDSATNISS